MKKMFLLLTMICLVFGWALADERIAIDVSVTEGALAGLTQRSGEYAGLDAMCLRDFDGDGAVQQWELDEHIGCRWFCEDDSFAVEPANGFMQWYEGDRTGFVYPMAQLIVPASADGKRVWCELTDKVTGERYIVEYTLHLNGMIARKPTITPQPVHLGANSWELQVEEGTEITVHLNDSLRESWDDELSYRWYKTKFTPDSGWAESASFENDGDTLSFIADMADNGWTYEWHLTSQNSVTGEYAAHSGQMLMYVYPKCEKLPAAPVKAQGIIPYENGMVLYSVYHELSENPDLPYSMKMEWRDRLIHNSAKGLSFHWTSEDEALQEKLSTHRGIGQHLMFELSAEEAQRLIENQIPFHCTVSEETTGEILANLTYMLVNP